MKHEPADPEVIELYSPAELKALLDRASQTPKPAKKGEPAQADYRSLLPVLALAGLAGMRFKEVLRLEWEDVFRIPGHIEVKAAKSKTRSRRLITMCDSLAGWLESYRNHSGLVWSKSYDMLHIDFRALREELEVKERRNGLRHAYISAHFAAYSDENLTAAQAGNSPDMVHKHYKGLLTKAQGEAWFAQAPERPANVVPMTTAQAKS
jgi:integrase